ncbi:TonB-dependent receptor plug domain-containing protein [Aurantiacibacter hainanensis]|uniref:TonB-dependent receptor plug domain-containing protein n=1 Tax=Aurantiacibacter hainanensis TaxID=3076114 RepID=UPI0030C6AE5A
MKYLLLASAAAAFVATPAFAQDDPAEDDANVIVVLGEGLPDTPAAPAYSTVEIDREQIVSTGSGRLDDVLLNVAGFQQFRRSDSRSSNPTTQGVTLRALGGNATTRALVTLDGVPLTDPFFGYVPFNAVAPERLGSVQVTRGGGTGPFGAGALAGTIALNSADAATLGLFNAQALVNDRGETQLSATAAPEVGDGYAVLSGRWDRGKGFFTTPEDQRVPATARAKFDSWSVSGRLVQQVGDDLELQVRGLAYDDARTLRFEGQDSTNEGQDLSARLVSRGPWQVDVLGYAQWRNFTNIVISSSSFNPVLDQRDTPSTGLGGKIEVRPPVGEANTLRLGVDYSRSEGDLEEVNAFSGPRFAGGVNSMLGFFAENDLELGNLILTGGVRVDRSSIRDGYYETVADGRTNFADRSDWYFSWRAGALFEATETLQLRAAAYTGLRQPTLNELYRPYQIFPVTYLANENLELERLEGYEVGIDWLPVRGAKLSITAFDNEVENAVANVTIGNNLNQRRNLDAIEARGIEASAEYQAGAFGLIGTLAVTDAEVRGTGFAAELDGLRPAQAPEWAASISASWRPVEGALFAATLRHVADQFEDDLETDVLPAATTVDLFAQYPLIDRLSVVGRVENLLDEEIVTLNRGGTLDLGVPQTFWIGLRYGF